MKFVKLIKDNNFAKLIAKRKPTYKITFETEDFINFCKNKGYNKYRRMADHEDVYIIDINGYKIEVSAGFGWSAPRLKDAPEGKFFNDRIGYSPAHSIGERFTDLATTDFNTNEEYFEYALKELIKFADSKLKTLKTTRNYKQNIQDKLNQLQEGKQINGTAKELLDLLKKLDDSSELIIKLK